MSLKVRPPVILCDISNFNFEEICLPLYNECQQHPASCPSHRISTSHNPDFSDCSFADCRKIFSQILKPGFFILFKFILHFPGENGVYEIFRYNRQSVTHKHLSGQYFHHLGTPCAGITANDPCCRQLALGSHVSSHSRPLCGGLAQAHVYLEAARLRHLRSIGRSRSSSCVKIGHDTSGTASFLRSHSACGNLYTPYSRYFFGQVRVARASGPFRSGRL